jgi:hypothetical protein
MVLDRYQLGLSQSQFDAIWVAARGLDGYPSPMRTQFFGWVVTQLRAVHGPTDSDVSAAVTAALSG